MIYLATYIGLLLIAIAGFSDAIIDTILFHYDISKFKNPKFNQSFWNNTISWRKSIKIKMKNKELNLLDLQLFL